MICGRGFRGVVNIALANQWQGIISAHLDREVLERDLRERRRGKVSVLAAPSPSAPAQTRTFLMMSYVPPGRLTSIVNFLKAADSQSTGESGCAGEMTSRPVTSSVCGRRVDCQYVKFLTGAASNPRISRRT